jgi:hypothetical protein
MNKKYLPHPIPTDDTALPEELTALTESIARNVHEVWAAARMADGWRYGKERNDTLKLHPCLIPYEELPDSERKFDRVTAFSTLRLIHKLGFEIKKK